MILKDPADVALNRLHVALCKAADQYEHSASIAADPKISAFFRELALERKSMAKTLEEHIRKIGLPRLPNPEREGLEKLATTLKTAVAGDRDAALINDQKTLEQNISVACTASLQERLLDSTREFVTSIAERILAAQPGFSAEQAQ